MEVEKLKNVKDIPEPLKKRWDTVIDEMLEACEVEPPESVSKQKENEITELRIKWWEEELNRISETMDKDYRFDICLEGETVVVNAYEKDKR